jgi:hypothetical protein
MLLLIDQNLSWDSTLLSGQLRSAERGIQSIDSILNQVSLGIYDGRLNIWLGDCLPFAESFFTKLNYHSV